MRQRAPCHDAAIPIGACRIGRLEGCARRLLLVLLLAAPALPAAGDSPQTGTLDGVVADAAGQPFAAVTVTLAGERGERTAVTDGDGVFRFGLLPPGAYRLRIVVEGLDTRETAVRLDAGQRRRVDLTLGPEASERVDVVAEVPLIDGGEAGAATTLPAAEAKEMVFTNRHYQAAITSLPGVVHSDFSSHLAELMPSVNGSLWQENAAFVDGVDTTHARFGGSSRILVPLSALAEVRSEAAAWGAEYGRVVGGVTSVVTRSGTNSLHGDFLYVAQSQAWEAQSDAVPVDRDHEVDSGHELSIGGPMVRDRAWFFAAAADNSSNQLTRLAGGEALETSVASRSWVGKLSVAPSDRLQLALTAIDTPASVPFVLPPVAEPAVACELELGGSFVTIGGSWTAARDVFLEARVAHQTSSEDRTPIAAAPIDPNASPDDPAGNQAAYWDGATTLRWHANGLPLGNGSLDFPRDQGNVALVWFLKRSELKLGADYQDVSWASLNRPPDRYLGSGYDPSLPGGFRVPQLKRAFLPIDSPVETGSTNLAVFAQDRVEIGERFAVTAGLRVEDQAHDDELGAEVLSSTDLTPRAAVVYDVGGRGRLLLKGTVGRYVTHIPQELVSLELSTLPNGANAFDEYRWNPATSRYDLFNRRQLPLSTTRVEDVEPYFKDEATAGLEWQMHPQWAVDARVIAWTVEAPFSATDQFDAQGNAYRLLTNFEQAERKYRALQIEVRRALRRGLVVRANYTLSRVEGNSSGNNDLGHADDDFLEAMAVLDAATAVPVTAVNRYGRLPHDRTHNLNLTGAKRFALRGRHGLALGGWLAIRSGRPWGLRRTVALQVPDVATTIVTTRNVEPRDAHELADTFTLNLTAAWEFPLGARSTGSLRAEVANVTDEQEQIGVNLATGQPGPVRQFYQKPRELRLVAGVRF